VLELTATLLSTIPAEAAAGPGRGIPIGNLTSQLFANVYLSPLDHYAQQHLGLRRYLRYVDDLVAVDEDRQRLQASREALQSFAHERLRLSFHPTKVTVAPVRAGVDFLGFVVFPTHLRVRRAAVCRFRRRERDLRRGYWQGRLTAERYWRSVVSWTAHAAHADSAGLLASLGLGGFR